MSPTDPPPRRREGSRLNMIGLVCAGVALAMVGAAYAAVPLYRAFCEATGFDGTVRRGEGPTKPALRRTVQRRRRSPWRGVPRFRPDSARCWTIRATALAPIPLSRVLSRSARV